MMKKLLLILFLVSSYLNPVLASADEVPADVYLKTSLNEIIDTLKSDHDLLRQHEKMDVYVSNQILPKFDFALTSKAIVGEAAWNAANENEQSNLTNEISLFFKHIFSKTLAEYDSQSLAFDEVSNSATGNAVNVNGRLLDPKDETVAFNSKMVKSPTGWKIYDVALGGVDLILTYKSNFKSIVENGGVVKLTSELHKKNEMVAAGKS